jgi:putative peptidoglycan lipid II flippase
MAAGSIVSRLTGFIRVAVIGAAIGGRAVNNEYTVAVAFPNMVFELLIGGVLSSVIVPVLVRRGRTDGDGGQAYAQRLLTLAVLALAAATVLAVAAAPLFPLAFGFRDAGPASAELVTKFGYLILPAIFFYGLAALFGAILNSREHFGAPMWAPILNNLVVITVAGVFIAVSTGKPTVESITTTQVLVLGLGTTLGIVVQAASLWPVLRRHGFRWRWRFDVRALGLGELGRLAAWMLVFVAVNQIGLFVVLNLANRAGNAGGAGVAIFQAAFLMFMMAHGIIAVSVMTALLPRMSAAAADGRTADLAEHLSSGIRLVSVALVPITAAYLLLGRPIAVTLFQWNYYTARDAAATGPVIAAAGLGLVPYAISQLQQFAFYALRDTRSPSLINIPVVAARIGIDVIFFLVLPATVVTAALMGGSAISFVLAAVLGALILRRRLGSLGLRRVGGTLVRLTGAAVLAAIPTYAVGYWIEHTLGVGKIASLVHLGAGGATLLATYLAATVLLGVAEVRQLWAMVASRLRR